MCVILNLTLYGKGNTLLLHMFVDNPLWCIMYVSCVYMGSELHKVAVWSGNLSMKHI